MSVGLANRYNVVHRHGGDIQVRSEPGGGTDFQINLPI
jgi:signal transduction histidine kinase